MNILVLGNGFDLAHGLPTSYINFLEFCEKVIPIYNGIDKLYISYKSNYKISPIIDAFITHVKKWILDNKHIVDRLKVLGD